MGIQGYMEYKSRKFCNSVRCPVQIELNKKEKASEEYEIMRQTCRTDCKYTTWQFHHWLIEKGYLIVKKEVFK